MTAVAGCAGTAPERNHSAQQAQTTTSATPMPEGLYVQVSGPVSDGQSAANAGTMVWISKDASWPNLPSWARYSLVSFEAWYGKGDGVRACNDYLDELVPGLSYCDDRDRCFDSTFTNVKRMESTGPDSFVYYGVRGLGTGEHAPQGDPSTYEGYRLVLPVSHSRAKDDFGIDSPSCDPPPPPPAPRFDPLVLDLEGRGRIDLIDELAPRFDIDGRGEQSKIGWVAPGVGLLALDLSGNGTIDTGRELFGDAMFIQSTLSSGNPILAKDGFAALAQFDENADTYITPADSIFDRILVWDDRNSNGFSEASELHSLAHYGIDALSLLNVKWIPHRSYEHAWIDQVGTALTTTAPPETIRRALTLAGVGFAQGE